MNVDAYITTYLASSYGSRDERLWSLYQRGKNAQWNAESDIDWSPEVSFGALQSQDAASTAVPYSSLLEGLIPSGRWDSFRWEYQAWMINQFLHGEQGALVATARLVETVPDLSAKSFAANQVGDEARHVEAYSRYIDEKLGVTYPMNPGLETVLRDLLSDSRWDIVYLGMQIIVEGLALAATRIASTGFGDPIIKSISRMIARDEARHISFGILALDGVYSEMTDPELADREDFLSEAIYQMSQRFLLHEVWERLEMDVPQAVSFVQSNPSMIAFRMTMFQRVVQALRHLGLLTPRVCAVLVSEGLARAGTLPSSDPAASIVASRPRHRNDRKLGEPSWPITIC
jgi:hypothetical protein